MRKWLRSYQSIDGKQKFKSYKGSYGHLLLEQKSESDAELVAALRPYFESAHFDARKYFHAEIGLSLHPDAKDKGAHAQYLSLL